MRATRSRRAESRDAGCFLIRAHLSVEGDELGEGGHREIRLDQLSGGGRRDRLGGETGGSLGWDGVAVDEVQSLRSLRHGCLRVTDRRSENVTPRIGPIWRSDAVRNWMSETALEGATRPTLWS